MEKKVTSVVMLSLLLIGMLTLTFGILPVRADPKTWYVDDSGGKDFTRIQDAIDAASPGDTIYVYNGIYFENLIAGKDGLTLIGESKSNTIIDGGGNLVININRNRVSVSGFTLQNGGQSGYTLWGSDILLYYAQYCNISDNILSSSRRGVGSYHGKHNSISGNTIFDINQGVALWYTLNETVTGNAMSNGVQYGTDPPYGVELWVSDDNRLMGNTISEISYVGIMVEQYAKNNVIQDNTISDAETGIRFYRSHGNTVSDNIISNSSWGDPYIIGGGIYLDHSYDNTLAHNRIPNATERGIHHYHSYHNTIIGNIISHITEIDSIGIFLDEDSYSNTVLDNVITKGALGIYTAGTAHDNNISGNIISNLTYYGAGINTWGPNNKIIGNTITNTSYVGIQLNSMSSDGHGVPDTCTNNIISGNIITQSTFGINLILATSYNTVVENTVSSTILGIFISDDSHDNTITGNLVSNNYYGIILFSSDNAKVYHNNFIDNTQQVLLSDSFNTAWDDGYPSGGNYWSDYADIDLFTGPGQDELGSDGIWDHPYVIDFENSDRYPFAEPWAPTVTATVDVDPDALNLISHGQWITAYIELPEGYDVGEIDISTIKLYGVIHVDPDAPIELGDYDSDGIPDLMVKFNKAEVVSIIDYAFNIAGHGFSTVSFRITGKLLDETPFEATDTVELLFPGDADGDADVDFNDFIIFASCYGTTNENPSYVSRADFNEDGTIDFNDFIIFVGNYGKTAV